ncbi:ABC transporter permease [Sphaerochaeta sp. PS]|uniref:ABC transporter permease n=1 Tax=Sphaerochaeta sp. PS TaxID=3076336 RepID=UPI0028A2E61B|nr:ABC transporter permease [Sphaerochaeta sp. PS]MDT4761789.1 ABC transporter permease [Sphaerochaeta sp. PS]
MQWSMVVNDCKRNRSITLALLLFMVFAEALAVLSALMGVQTYTSISALYKVAQPPHFVQMHKGPIDELQISKFFAEHEMVTYSQISTMLDVYGESITVIGSKAPYDLSGCRLDIGLVKQNPDKDLLLNSSHEKVVLQEGEIGIPTLLQKMYGVEIGDRIVLSSNGIQKEFVVKECILDAMMNSPMASSTRILLSDRDFDGLEGRVGEKEYLIEAYLTNPKDANAFKTAYEDASLAQNGQAVTYAILFILSALTDIVTVFVLLLVSLLLVVVSFICVKFTIMAALEEEVKEIGTMKAIGLTFVDIRGLYLAKYRTLAVAGIVAGYLVALCTIGAVTSHISSTFGATRFSFLTVLVSLAVSCLVFLLLDSYCKKTLRKIQKLTVVDALVSGKGFGKRKASSKDGLHRVRRLPVNALLAVREVLHAIPDWTIVFTVVVIAFLMIMIPVNLLNTFEAPEFITYMGSSLEDILIEVENGEQLETNAAKVNQVLATDGSIAAYNRYRTVRVKTSGVKGTLINLDIDTGKMAGKGLQYLDGRAPEGQHELAISYLNANALEKGVGETLVLSLAAGREEYLVSGIYQDVTSGGYTAKAIHDFADLEAKKYSFSVILKDSHEVESKASAWATLLGAGITVDPMERFIDQTLGGVAKQLRAMVIAVVMLGASLVVLITVLFLKLRLAKDGAEIAILKAIGFSHQDILWQYLLKMGLVSLGGVLTGMVLTAFLGERLVNGALAMADLGVRKVHLITDPLVAYGVCPLVLLALILLVTSIVLRTSKNKNIISLVRE